MALDMLTQGSDAPVRESLKAEALSVKETASKWSMGSGIQGFGIGRKMTSDKELKDKVLKVYVEKKLPLNKCKAPVPKTVKIASLSKSIPTDVEEIGKVEAEPNTTKERPAIPGFGLGHTDISVGTLGCLVRKTSGPSGLYILSNSHVLADEGLAAKGDKIIQPGDHDGGIPSADVIAVLDDFVPFIFTDTEFPNRVDAAIAKVKLAKQVTSAIRKIGVPQGIARARIGTQVQKTGRTTDYTIGRVRDVNYRFALDYMKPGENRSDTFRVGFTDQVLCTRYTAGGDSGSAVLNMDKKVVGLHFAGSTSSSIFSPIHFVLDALSITIVTTQV